MSAGHLGRRESLQGVQAIRLYLVDTYVMPKISGFKDVPTPEDSDLGRAAHPPEE